jgi:hypothetical protein
METYTETVHRYRIVRLEEKPEEHKARLRIMGINPDDDWQLIWSFENKKAANHELKNLKSEAAWFQTYKLVDAGEATTIERPIY